MELFAYIFTRKAFCLWSFILRFAVSNRANPREDGPARYA